MVDSFIFYNDWIIALALFCIDDATTIELPAMSARRFPPPWTVEEQPARFVARHHNFRDRHHRTDRQGWSKIIWWSIEAFATRSL